MHVLFAVCVREEPNHTTSITSTLYKSFNTLWTSLQVLTTRNLNLKTNDYFKGSEFPHLIFTYAGGRHWWRSACQLWRIQVRFHGAYNTAKTAQIWNKYSQKWNCAASVPVPKFMFLWAIYIFPWSVCLFCCRKIGGPIVGIYKSLTETMMWKLGLRPRSLFSGST